MCKSWNELLVIDGLGPDLQKILWLCYDNIYVEKKKSYNNLKIKLQQKLRYNYDHKIDVLNVNNNNENGER